MKKQVIKNRVTLESFQGFVNYLRAKKQTFDIITTGYSKRIIWKEKEFSYLTEDSSPFAFVCHRAMKKDILDSGVTLGAAPRYSVQYYGVNEYVRNADVLPETVLNIDINSAYLTALKKMGVITAKTFEYVNRADKETRLKACGMLAMMKIKIRFTEGAPQPILKEDMINDALTTNAYLSACNEVGNAMHRVLENAGRDFLFFWVDGIYLKTTVRAESVINILKDEGFESKFKYLFNCSFETSGKTLYFSHSVDQVKRKRFSIPFTDEEERKKLNNYIKTLTINERQFCIENYQSRS